MSDTVTSGAAGSAGRVAPPVTRIRPSSGWVPLDLGALWAYRELLGFLAWRDVKVRYKQTVLGALWAILQPFAAMVIFTIFFHRMAGIAPEGGVPYPLWSYAGLLAWTYFARALQRSSESIVTDRALVTRIYFPRLVIPLAGAISPLIDLAVAFIVYGGMLAYYRVTPGPELAYLPALILFAMAAALGVGLWLSALNALFRDVRHVVPFLVQIWLFVTPVVYPSTLVPEEYRTLFGLNPMAGVVEGFRWCLLGTGRPEPMFWVSVGMTAALLVSGAYYFRRMERTIEDVV